MFAISLNPFCCKGLRGIILLYGFYLKALLQQFFRKLYLIESP